jgi:ORF6N domain
VKPKKPIESLIFTLRGQKVMRDADLAELYDVPPKVFNQAVKRNFDRFPADFAFQLNAADVANMRSQFVTSSFQANEVKKTLRTHHKL